MERPKADSLPALIADDEAVNQKSLSLLLEKLGCASILARDGLDLLEKAEANSVSLVFTDIQMPGLDGCKAAEILRSRGFTRPIIAFTAGIQPEEWENCRRAGMDDILIKPAGRAGIERILLKWKDGRREGSGQSGNAAPLQAFAPAGAEDTAFSAAGGAAFDPAGLRGAFMNDMDMALPFLSRFIERTKEQLAAFPALIKAGGAEDVRRGSHTIKGAALTMGGAELGGAAARFETAYAKGGGDETEAAYSALKEAFERFRKEAEDFIQRGKPSRAAQGGVSRPGS